MSALIKGPREGFPAGVTPITTVDDESGIALSVLKLEAQQSVLELTVARETCWLLLSGEARVQVGGHDVTLARRSLFDDPPSAALASADTKLMLTALTDAELLVCETKNTRPFLPRIFPGAAVPDEHRGKGKVHDAAFRFVRTVFDSTNAPPEAELVVGEVINFPGRWSSYPPHHHPQPELYHYRFSDPRGYGHAELGEDVLRVRAHDTVRILRSVDHPQCAAPGYAMYYAWVIRHLPGKPYLTPEFNPEHAWTMADGATCWWPKGVETK